jgi:hypothetical protein
MSSIAISLIAFACVFGGALAGMLLRGLLPQDDLSADSKDTVKLGMALVSTMAALVLGLLNPATYWVRRIPNRLSEGLFVEDDDFRLNQNTSSCSLSRTSRRGVLQRRQNMFARSYDPQWRSEEIQPPKGSESNSMTHWRTQLQARAKSGRNLLSEPLSPRAWQPNLKTSH